LAQLKEIIEDEMNTDKRSIEVQEQEEDCEEVLDPENTSSVLKWFSVQSTTNLNTSVLLRLSGY
jgi:hypothetical protein